MSFLNVAPQPETSFLCEGGQLQWAILGEHTSGNFRVAPSLEVLNAVPLEVLELLQGDPGMLLRVTTTVDWSEWDATQPLDEYQGTPAPTGWDGGITKEIRVLGHETSETVCRLLSLSNFHGSVDAPPLPDAA